MTNNIEIRLALPQDKEFIYNSLSDIVVEAGVKDRFSLTKESLEKIMFFDKLVEAFIAVKGNDLAGLAVFSVTHRNFMLFNKSGLYLHDIYILPKYRRQGIATKLIDKLKETAKERNLGRIDFMVLKNNAAGNQLYDALPDVNEVDYIKYMRIKVD